MDAKKLSKLRELSDIILTTEQKKLDLLSELALLEKIKLDAEIEVEEVLCTDWTEKELMGCVL